MGRKKRHAKRQATIPRGFAPNLLLIAVGYAFTALDVTVNGFELLLPDFIGYILIAAGCSPDRSDDLIGRITVVLASALALVSLPDVIRFAYRESFRYFDSWIFYPREILESLLAILVAFLIWREAKSRGLYLLQMLAVATVPILALSLLAAWRTPPASNGWKALALLSQQTFGFWLIGVSALAHRRISRTR